ncbi:MAG: internal scaffolding protein [Arizlama microvirus]|nr:MAG: internal scaffolding protein [Arizlama microvirus]
MITIARTQYDERLTFESDLGFVNSPSLTKQSDLKDTDINSIFKKYERTGQLPDLIVKNGRYGDFSEVPTYQESLDIVRTAQEQFDALGVEVRNRFNNNPAEFLAFATNPANIDEIERMGLLKPEAMQARVDARNAAAKAESDASAAKLAADAAKAKADLIAEIKNGLK